MKDKLRELAETYANARCTGGPGALFNAGLNAAYKAASNDIKAILDAEGDGVAVGDAAAAEVYEYGRDRNEPVPRLIKGIRFTSTPLPVGTKLYTHPARSGVVSDEDVVSAIIAAESFSNATRIGFETMRAALEHFAKGEHHER